MSIKNYLFILIIATVFIIGCKKEDDTPPAPFQFGTMKDIDGNKYITVKIGTQWWMAQDLKTTKYRDSAYIKKIKPPPFDTIWKHDTIGGYCLNLNSQDSVIGVFYDWYAVNDTHKLAPKGWHIPTDADWKTLEMHLGMNMEEANKTSWRGTHEGEKLKVPKGIVGGWSDYGNVWATNESGFAAMSTGCRMFDGSWGDPGLYSTGYWWTASSQGNDAWYRYLDYKNANVFRYYGSKHYGFSVRCVKD